MDGTPCKRTRCGFSEDGPARPAGWAGTPWTCSACILTKATARVDCMGLVPLLKSRPVVVITENSAAIRSVSGGTLTFHRHESPPPERCLIWELAAPEMEVA